MFERERREAGPCERITVLTKKPELLLKRSNGTRL